MTLLGKEKLVACQQQHCINMGSIIFGFDLQDQ